ncbi:leucine-rich repeat protein [Flagellimonas sp. HMM57]|uniref:leucine-rich repeat protein n=1 Tax=unclassified Flagellimonas TaxID=2644544 RepID=UPI0013D034F5|nr:MULTISPECIES: leucine-rich repeat protein [unclassified Flagellimonas]UII76438.1 leucine-rich repeat protein [Flagellimonas sp. HMM57]
MEKQLQLIMYAIFMALTGLTTYGQEPGLDAEFEQSGITYKVTSTSPDPYEVKVVGNTNTGDVVIPPVVVNVQNWNVTSIGDRAFQNDQVTSIDIPEGVTYIGDRAFADDKINSVVIPTTVIRIESYAFWNSSMTSLEILEGVVEIGDNAFARNSLTSVTIPASVTSIGGGAFITHPSSPSKMTELTMLGSVPPALQESSFTTREEIHVTVPNGAQDAYEERVDSDWGGFASIEDNIFTIDGITYEFSATTQAQVKIVDYDTDFGTEVTIPPTASYKGTDYQVTAIGDRAFYNKQLTELTFSGESNVAHIGQDAFWGVDDLKNQLGSVVIPNSVTSLGQRAFGTCGLTSVKIPENITNLEKWVFAANDLRDVTIPAKVESIGFQAFYNSLNLSTVTVWANPPMESGRLDPAAFNNQANQRITFDLVVPPGAIQAYENSAWADYANTITYGVFNQDGIKYGIMDASGEATVIYGSSLNPVIHPEVNIGGVLRPVTAIGDNAFDTRDIQTIVIPSTVKSIGDRAFYSQHIFRVVVMADEPPELHDDAFLPLRRPFIEVFVPKDRVQDYIDAGWIGFKSVRTPVGKIHNNNGLIWKITSIRPNEAELVKFIGLNKDDGTGPRNLKLEEMFGTEGHVKIPSEISYIRNSENDGMYTVTSIGDDVFTGDGDLYGAAGMYWSPTADPLKSVDIPDGVTHIGDCAFCGNNLTEVDIPNGVTSIGEDAFWQNQLTGVEIPESVTRLGQRAFGTCGLTEVAIPNSITRIEKWAFSQNDLEEVIISANVEYIGEQAFYQNDLKEVTIPGNVRTIDLYAFQKNPDLHLVTVEADDPPSLHELAFANADRGQIDLVVPFGKRQEYLDNGWHGFRSISYGIFTVDNIKYGITTRTEVMVVDYTGTDTAVTIPETADNGQYIYDVTAIGESAFQNKGLTHVEIPASVTSIGELAFGDNQLTGLAIPGSVESIGPRAFYNNPGLGLVEVGANDPPVLNATAFANANRHQIDLVVPTGKRQEYLDNGWNGFKSIKEEIGVSIDAPAETVNLSPFTVTFRFDLDVTGFTVDDIDLGGNATADHFTGSGSIYTVEVTPTSCNGTIAIDVPANAVDMPNSTNLRATATVTVEEDPDYLVAIARDIIVQLDADGHATILPEDVDNGSAYGCGNTPELSLDRDAFTCDDVGTPVTVTLTADHGTESATTTATVTVEEDPNYLVAIAKDITVQLDAGGRATILPEDVDDGSVYGCGNTPELSLDRDAFTCGDVRTPVTVILTANHGTESTTATALVTVEAATGSCGKSSSLVNFNRGFSPNGDGSGDTLVIEGLEKYRNNVLSIYDLSQRLLFSAHYGGPGDGWDGTHEGGTVPVGSYVCVIDYNEPGLGHEAKMIYVNY